jgi:hypothetical protein
VDNLESCINKKLTKEAYYISPLCQPTAPRTDSESSTINYWCLVGFFGLHIHHGKQVTPKRDSKVKQGNRTE